jgi:hypothetical protein
MSSFDQFKNYISDWCGGEKCFCSSCKFQAVLSHAWIVSCFITNFICIICVCLLVIWSNLLLWSYLIFMSSYLLLWSYLLFMWSYLLLWYDLPLWYYLLLWSYLLFMRSYLLLWSYLLLYDLICSYVLLFTLYVLLFTLYVLLFTLYVLLFTLYVLLFAFYVLFSLLLAFICSSYLIYLCLPVLNFFMFACIYVIVGIKSFM